MLEKIHVINPQPLLLLLLLLSSFLACIKASAVPSRPNPLGTILFVDHARSSPRDAFTCIFDDETAPVPPPASHDETSTASTVSSREITPPSPPPEQWHLILEENASFLPAQAAAVVVLEAFYKAVNTTVAYHVGDEYLVRLLFGELELMFSPLARMQAFVAREMASVWLEYIMETVVMGALAAYRGWMFYGPDVRVRVVMRVREQVGVDGVGMGWRGRW